MNIKEHEALVMEAFDFGQFAKDMLGGHLVESVRVALVQVLEDMHTRLYGTVEGQVEDYTKPIHCMCSACRNGVIHDSDCTVHNEPAGPCDCSVKAAPSDLHAAIAGLSVQIDDADSSKSHLWKAGFVAGSMNMRNAVSELVANAAPVPDEIRMENIREAVSPNAEGIMGARSRCNASLADGDFSMIRGSSQVQTAVAVPSGCYLVPFEPDEAMTKAGFKYARALNCGQLIETWQAMCLAAHPQEPKP